MDKAESLMLGEIKGKLDLLLLGQDKMCKKIDSLTDRVSIVEGKAARNGSICGALVAIGVAIAIEHGKKLIG